MGLTRRQTLSLIPVGGVALMLGLAGCEPQPDKQDNAQDSNVTAQAVRLAAYNSFREEGDEIKHSDKPVKRAQNYLENRDPDSPALIVNSENGAQPVNYAERYVNYVSCPSVNFNMMYGENIVAKRIDDEELYNLARVTQKHTGVKGELPALPQTPDFMNIGPDLPIIESEMGTTIMTGLLRYKNDEGKLSPAALLLKANLGDSITVSNNGDLYTSWKIARKTKIKYKDATSENLIKSTDEVVRLLHIVLIEDYADPSSDAFLISCLPG
jgi:lipoprotein